MLEGTVGTTLPSPLRLATDTVSLETWSWGDRDRVLVSTLPKQLPLEEAGAQSQC